MGRPFSLLSFLAIAGQALLTAGITFLILALFPNTHPVFVFGFALAVAALLQPLRMRIQTTWLPRPDFDRNSISEWMNTFHEFVAASHSINREWQALEQTIRAALAPTIIHEFRLHPENGQFLSSTTDFSFSNFSEFVHALQRLPSFQPLDSIPGKAEEIARLQALRVEVVLPLIGKDALVGFLALGKSPQCDVRSDQARQFLQSLADAFHSSTSAEEPNWSQLAAEVQDIQSMTMLCEWLHAQISPWIPLRALRLTRILPEQQLGVNVCFIVDGRRLMELEAIAFSLGSDLCSLVSSTGTAFFTESNAQVCRALGKPAREPDGAWGGAPLLSAGRILGILAGSRDIPFSDVDRTRWIRFADLASPAFVRILWQEQSNRTGKQMATQQRIARRLAVCTEMETLLLILLEGACELAGASSAVIFLSTSEGNWVPKKAIGTELPANSLSASIFLSASQRTGPTLIAHADEDALLYKTFPSLDHAIILPIRRQDSTLAVILLENPTGLSPFPQEEENSWFAFTSMAAMAMQNLRLTGQTDPALTAVVEDLASLQRLDQELNAAPDVRGALEVSLDWAIRNSESTAGVALMRSPTGLQIIVTRGYPSAYENESACDWASIEEDLDTGRPAIFHRHSSPVFPGRHPNAGTALLLPIVKADQTLGAFLLEADWEGAFPSARLDLLQRMSAHAAAAIAHAQLRAEVVNTNQAKSEFISFVAHELKTPMTSIRGYTDLLAQGAVGPINPSQANFLGTIRSNADRLATLVSDLNDVSRIETGRLRLEFAQCTLATAVEEVLESLHAQIEAKEQRITLDVSPHLPSVWADRDRLIQILTNLVSNAHKYTPAGGTLRIFAERSANGWDESGAPDVLLVSIQDSGLGISPQDQKSIFQKFFRAEDRSVRDLPGTGLGLHITRNLIELQGGRIWFETELHKGSTFHFTLPVASLPV